jgi:hypothetical protein
MGLFVQLRRLAVLLDVDVATRFAAVLSLPWHAW